MSTHRYLLLLAVMAMPQAATATDDSGNGPLLVLSAPDEGDARPLELAEMSAMQMPPAGPRQASSRPTHSGPGTAQTPALPTLIWVLGLVLILLTGAIRLRRSR